VILIIVGSLGLFYLGLGEVRKYAVEVNHSIADADASKVQLEALQGLKSQLAQSETSIAKANQMFATPDNYQNKAITDTRNYANASGLTIERINFDDAVSDVGPAMTVSLKAPVSYSKLIRFLDGIEGNMPKMQVSNISLTHVNGAGADSVAVDDIKIMIATN
jgi:type II secretory pathway component PulM